MAVVVNRSDLFPVGTVVGAYALYAPDLGRAPASGEPKGTKASEQTVAASGALTVTGLTPATPYLLWASVGGADRYLFVRESVPPGAFNTPTAWVSLEPEVGTLPGPEIDASAGEATSLVRLGYRIASGTSVSFKIQNNGVDVAGLTGLSATTTPASATAAVALKEGDFLTCVISAVTGAPKGFSATLQLNHAPAT